MISAFLRQILPRTILISLALLILLPGIPGTRRAAAAVPEISRLRCGASLVTLYEPNSAAVAIDVFFRVGLSDEGRNPGITALVTRAWFSDGRFRSANQLRRDIGASGSGVGSYFGGDFAEIWSVSGTSDAAIEQSAQTLLLNLVASPGFGPEAITAAKEQQQRALALEQANPLAAVLNQLRSRVWFESPQGRALLGNAESVAAITAREVAAHYLRFFRPSRAVIVVAGNLPPERARRLVEQSLNAAGWSEADRPVAPEIRAAPERVPQGLRDLLLDRPAPASILAAGYLTAGTLTAGSEEWVTLLLLDAVLGGGKTSRLFRLRDDAVPPSTPIGYEVRTLLLPFRSQSLWTAYVIGSGPVKATRTAVLATLSALGTGTKPVTDVELARAKAYLKGRHLVQRQRLKERSFGVGWAEVMGLGGAFDTGYDARIDAITLDAVNRLGRQTFGAANAAVVSTE
ncbi:MAG: insulinase family protein [Cytophagales bacterium]|nr:insulinase family protein [Armatimonadota bacterium]